MVRRALKRLGKWTLVLGVVALLGMGTMRLASTVVGFAASYLLDGATEPQKAPCAEALAFGGAKLPRGAHDAHCTVQAWLDTSYDATFRMPRNGVRAWLKATYPHAPGPETEYCADGAAYCLNLNGGGDDAPPARAEADAVEVDVAYEGRDQALVRFSAFTV
ncbi:hypothetical protein AB0L59_14200 [Streptomyces sp. NPDC052109]|uniref:hypothetical protein n=1 Tax=Streptomyces sp. NPDC052109 TaxID=3155527 RepID=UPI00341B875C